MALINRNSNDYDGGASAWAGGIRNIGTMLAQMPAIRANAAARTAQAGEANARAGLLTAQASTVDDENSGHLQFADALKRLAADPNDTSAMGDAFEGMGKGFKTDPKNTAAAMGILLKQTMARNGSTNVNQMAELEDGGASKLAVADANNAAKAALPASGQATLPSGSTLVDRLTGQPVVQAPANVPTGNVRTAPTVGTNAPAIAVTGPKSSAQKFPPGVENQLAKVLIPMLQKTNTAPGAVSNLVTRLAESLAPSVGGGSAASPASSAMVRVQHPNGQTGMIPAANLQSALQQGYKQIGQ